MTDGQVSIDMTTKSMEKEFEDFPKMARLSRECIVTEKIDGTNVQILITQDGEILTGSRTRWITPQDDNYGFARWVEGNKQDILTLGAGRHFGEWWGQGIQRNYGLKEKRFSLFNVTRWVTHDGVPQIISGPNEPVVKYQNVLPQCVGLVPTLWRGIFSTEAIENALKHLELVGSYASPGFMNPEGIVVFHTAGMVGFKKTIKDDGIPKSMKIEL